jgi:hypothetical protein
MLTESDPSVMAMRGVWKDRHFPQGAWNVVDSVDDQLLG